MNYPKRCLPWEIYWNIQIISEEEYKIYWIKKKKERQVKCINTWTWEIWIYTVSSILKWSNIWKSNKIHGMYWSLIYKKYAHLKERCNNPKHISYKNYGWRWIQCEWNTFEEFYLDMGESYREWLTLDRINNDGNYCKENCHWTNWNTQCNNTRRNIFFEINWIKKTLKQWCDEKWLNYKTVFSRIKYSWKSFEDALY